MLPILLFQGSYLWLYGRRIIRMGRLSTTALLVAFIIAAAIGAQFTALLNGSLGYTPALLVLVGLGAYHVAESENARPALLAAAGVFIVSVFFRSIDLAACEQISTGTHFVWHALNAGVVYLVMRGLVLNWPRS